MTIITNPKPTKENGNMAKVKIQPLGDRVLVEAIEEKEQTKGGIIIPDSAKEKPQEAKVVAIGPGKLDEDGKRVPVEVKVGDLVLTSKYGGTEIKYNDKEYKILSSSDILAIIG
jgi:chaperonin GroES